MTKKALKIEIPRQDLESWQGCDEALQVISDLDKSLRRALGFPTPRSPIYLSLSICFDDLKSDIQGIRDELYDESDEAISSLAESMEEEREKWEMRRRLC